MPPAPRPVRRRRGNLTISSGTDTLQVAEILSGALPRVGEFLKKLCQYCLYF